MTEFTYITPKGEQSAAVVHKLSPYRLGQLAPIRKKYPADTEAVMTLFDMAKVDPELSFVSGEERGNVQALLNAFNKGEADEETTRKLLLSIMERENRFEGVAEKLKEAQEYLSVMCEFPKGLKLDAAFWERQNPKEVLRAGKFFRTEIEDCFS